MPMMLNLEPVNPGYIITFRSGDEWHEFWTWLSEELSQSLLIDGTGGIKVPFDFDFYPSARVKFDMHGKITDWGWDDLRCYNSSSTYNEYIRVAFSEICFQPADISKFTQTIDQLLEV